jgi:hypothetical protein
MFDMSIDAPNLKTNEKQLREAISSQGGEEPTLNEYIIASQASKLLTGKYLDGATWSRILGSRSVGDVVGARFGSGGGLGVISVWPPGGRAGGMGGRFSRGVN